MSPPKRGSIGSLAALGAPERERYAESFQRKTVGVLCRVKKTPRVLLLQRLAKCLPVLHVVEPAEIFRVSFSRLHLEIDQNRPLFF